MTLKGKNVVIIGSGFGGLALGIRLQSRGAKVTILEKQAAPGGHAQQLKAEGFTFDMGPSLVTAPDVVDQIFQSAGKKMSDYLELIPLDPYYRIYFHDGSYLDYSGNTERMKEQLATFHPKDAARYDAFMESSRIMEEAVIKKGLGTKPFMTLKSMISFAPKAIRLGVFLPAYTFVKRYFKDPRSRFVFSFHPLFIGGNPFKAPAVYQMIPWLEKEGGVHYTPGGMYSLIQAFTSLFQELGGHIHTSEPATRIETQNRRVTGVKSSQSFYPADIVVSNADFYHTYHDLVDAGDRKKWRNKKLEKIDYSMSSVLIYLGLDRKYDKLKHHTLIISKDYKRLIRNIFDKKKVPFDFSMYLHVPSRTDKTMAIPGGESMYVLVPVANQLSRTNWDEFSEMFVNSILHYLEHSFGLEDFSKHIIYKSVFTPEDFQKDRNNHLGAAWGVEPKLTQSAYLRPHNRSEDIQGLYLVGASTHPGAGLPGTLMTAETTEHVILTETEGV
ncbi:phytoene desaturase family protein [Fidelibacter multiformis]|uniref:phytoene desaturase family protein n=1 Tax=Fidelibacter multiformis TaxID=3377529 RepID=UPI0037DDD1FE